MTSLDTDDVKAADYLLVCSQLSESLEFYTGQLGFRLEAIYPADNPRVVNLSGYGIRVCLKQLSTCGDAPPPSDPSIIVQKSKANSWGEGRAGMQYRDLVPARRGGRYIASHIRIPIGGPVADYVHHHHVRFQMIYCYKGWVRVVYEDQGEPFIMHPGDCVLQPPHIRHRVLESSDGMEVIEIACPAEHETLVDHELELPTTTVNRNRQYARQRFVFHQLKEASWVEGPGRCFETREIGIARATDQLASAVVLRSSGPGLTASLRHDAEFFFNFVLSGSSRLQTPAQGSYRVGPADCFVIPADDPFVLSEISPDFELLQLTLPGTAKLFVHSDDEPRVS